ncbi:hypothetical protein V6N12_022980 [Hibiscus sabdariffa]|uniref:Uncharacterized protein n=1 Tax=Hibiscus sabdariffa TaxID=183260 RepID=A0ABR2FWC3_9ROSI
MQAQVPLVVTSQRVIVNDSGSDQQHREKLILNRKKTRTGKASYWIRSLTATPISLESASSSKEQFFSYCRNFRGRTVGFRK